MNWEKMNKTWECKGVIQKIKHQVFLTLNQILNNSSIAAVEVDRFQAVQVNDKILRRLSMVHRISHVASPFFQRALSQLQLVSSFAQMVSIPRTIKACQRWIFATSSRKKPIFTSMRLLRIHSMTYLTKDTLLLIQRRRSVT